MSDKKDDTGERVNRLIDAAHTHVIENGAIDNRSAAKRRRDKHVRKDPGSRGKPSNVVQLKGLPKAPKKPTGNGIQTARNESNTRMIIRTFIKGEQVSWLTFNKRELGRVIVQLQTHHDEMIDEVVIQS